MNGKLKNQLIEIAKLKIKNNDPSHDFYHSLRVMHLAEKISKKENADLDIIIPASLFHDIIAYPKNRPESRNSSDESAYYAEKLLRNIGSFPKFKINKVCNAIKLCSFTKALKPNFLEAKILQDADGLESMGAISIMRTFSSTGIMNKVFYNSLDPFCKKRKPNDNKYALDLFFTRLLTVKERLHTKTANDMATRRIRFLKDFLIELKLELADSA